jgi:hypothetical protein
VEFQNPAGRSGSETDGSETGFETLCGGMSALLKGISGSFQKPPFLRRLIQSSFPPDARIARASGSGFSLLKDVGIDLRRAQVLMTQNFLLRDELGPVYSHTDCADLC